MTLRHYRLPSGRVGFAAGSAPAVPSSIASDVQGVLGLDTLVQAQRMSLKPAHPLAHPQSEATGAAPQPPRPSPRAVPPPRPAASTAPTPPTSSPRRTRSTPSTPGGDTGAGTSVALYELEPHLSSDISAYQSCMGTSATVTQTNVDGGAGSGAGEGEAALDVEDVIGLAPAASIDVYNGPNTESGAYDTYAKIVSDDTSQVISTSWGLCEASEGSSSANSENTLFEEAASQGQSVFAAAGDSGADDCGNGTRAVDDPASQPDVTGVGGTHPVLRHRRRRPDGVERRQRRGRRRRRDLDALECPELAVRGDRRLKPRSAGRLRRRRREHRLRRLLRRQLDRDRRHQRRGAAVGVARRAGRQLVRVARSAWPTRRSTPRRPHHRRTSTMSPAATTATRA